MRFAWRGICDDNHYCCALALRKPLTFTKHARDALAERELDRDWLERAVYEPHWSHPDPRRSGIVRRFRIIPEFGGRILRVACLETDDEIRIITVFFDRDAREPR